MQDPCRQPSERWRESATDLEYSDYRHLGMVVIEDN